MGSEMCIRDRLNSLAILISNKQYNVANKKEIKKSMYKHWFFLITLVMLVDKMTMIEDPNLTDIVYSKYFIF